MRPFAYASATTSESAIATLGARPAAKFIAGGTNIVDLMIDTVETPELLVDINALPFRTIERHEKFLRIGALARMSDVADDAAVKAAAPMVSQALDASASAQLRNAASIGGNILQRTRCAYFRDVSQACNKRAPGTGCAALHGENRQHAILGASEHCIATHASDLAVALSAASAIVRVRGTAGERGVPIGEFYVEPGSDPRRETVLAHGELIVAVDIPLAASTSRSTYLKVRDRESYQFALTSAAVGISLARGAIAEARFAIGGVGTVPWRSSAAEASLLGKPPTRAAFETAADIALRGAVGRGANDYKIPLARRTVALAFMKVSG